MMKSTCVGWMAIGATVVAGCGGTPGARPHDMSEAAHEEAAQDQEQQAAAIDAGRPRWSSDVEPTGADRAEAERHRRAAADHRAAAEALRSAEGQACVGIDDRDRDMSPFGHRADISAVAPLTETVQTGRITAENTVGATVVFRARPGMTEEWLQRLVDCHLARNAAMGHQMPEMEYCPLMPAGVTARVRSTGNGFAISVRSDDPATAEEVLRRARALAPSGE